MGKAPEIRVFEDPSFPAYFRAAGKKFKIIPRQDHSGRVVFAVEGEGIDEALQELYSDHLVGVLSFIKELKALRSSIFALKRR